MTCKNCGNILEERTSFCEKCGAKVIKDRITTIILIQELLASFGWDSLYVNTLKKMFTQPQEVLKGYLDGARKKYVNPFAYLAVGAALSLIIFNFFSKEFIEANNSFNKSQNEALQEKATADLSKLTDISEKELENLKREQKQAQFALKFGDTYYNYFVNYFNIISFLFIPFYALISKLTFRKPNNYGEHIVINSYLQGTTMYISIIFFIVGMITTPKLYPFSTLAFIMFYLYAFGKLYQLNTKQIILKFLRFCIISVLLFIVIVIVITIFSLIIGLITGYTNP